MQPELNRALPAAVLLCLCASLPATAQDCRITGHLTDASRAAVATAVITVTEVDSGAKRQVLSNAQGFFRIAPLPPGKYRIDAVKPGFMPLSRTGVELGPGSTATVDLRMDDAEVAETATLEVRKTGAGSLLVYFCGLSRGSGCEMLEPLPTITQADLPILP
jgi:hypothetical protein